MAFLNSFFSLAGQAERLSNIASVLNIAVNPFSKDKIVANTTSPILKSSLEFVANNPYTTAGIVAAGASGLAKSAVSTAIKSTGAVTKVVASTGLLLGTGTVAMNPSLIAPIISTASKVTPESILSLGGTIGTATKTPSIKNISSIATENPVLVGALALGAGLLVSKTVVPVASNLANTIATRANTAAIASSVDLSQASPDFLKAMKQYEENQSKAAKELEKTSAKTEEKALEAQLEVTKINAKAALELEQEKTKQVEIISKAQSVTTPLSPTTQDPPVVAATSKVTTKKKTTKKKAKKKKKAKPKPKKKAKKTKKVKKKKKK